MTIAQMEGRFSKYELAENFVQDDIRFIARVINTCFYFDSKDYAGLIKNFRRDKKSQQKLGSGSGRKSKSKAIHQPFERTKNYVEDSLLTAKLQHAAIRNYARIPDAAFIPLCS
jgi:hypothetical protein